MSSRTRSLDADERGTLRCDWIATDVKGKTSGACAIRERSVNRPGRSAHLSSKLFESTLQIPISELKPALLQLLRNHSGARQNPLLRKFSKRQLRRKTRHRNNRRTLHHRRQHSGELRIGHRIRRGHIHRTPQRFSPQNLPDRRHNIVNMNPTPPLPAAAYPPAQAKPKRPQHLLERATIFTQHYAEPQIHHANSSDPHMCRRFPLATDIWQKSRTSRAVLRQDLVAPIAVISNRGSADKRSGRLFSFCDRPRQIQCAHHPALANFPLLLRTPSSGNVLARQMDHGIDSRNQCRRNFAHRLPGQIISAPGRTPHQSDNFISIGFQFRHQRRSDQSRSSADKNSRHRQAFYFVAAG